MELQPGASSDPVEIRWIAADTGGVAPKDHVISSSKFEAGKTEGQFTLSKPTNGFPVGKYRIELRQADKLEFPHFGRSRCGLMLRLALAILDVSSPSIFAICKFGAPSSRQTCSLRSFDRQVCLFARLRIRHALAAHFNDGLLATCPAWPCGGKLVIPMARGGARPSRKPFLRRARSLGVSANVRRRIFTNLESHPWNAHGLDRAYAHVIRHRVSRESPLGQTGPRDRT
jgi:hypothetical protein